MVKVLLWMKIFEDGLGNLQEWFGSKRNELTWKNFFSSIKEESRPILDKEEHVSKAYKVLFKDLEKNNQISSYGRKLLLNEIKNYLYNKSKVYEILELDSSLSETRIFRPVFIISLPRTGSSFLHCLLSQDKRWKAPAYWEILQQVPVITDPLMENHENTINSFNLQANYMKDIWGKEDIENSHCLDTRDPEDIATLLAAEGLKFLLNDVLDLPNYNDYLANISYETWVKMYSTVKLRLQVLTRFQNMEERRLMLMFHLGSFNNKLALLEVFPDAQFVFLHRDVKKIIPSVSSLFSYLARQYYHIGKEEVQPICDKLTKRYLKEIQTLDDWLEHEKFKDTNFKRVHHVNFKDLVQSPIDVVKEIYKSVDMEYNEECEAVFNQYITNQKQHKRNIHKYRNMNVKEKEITDITRSYVEKYNIQIDL